jgi:prepilin-type N-terminal cleavage/methylation domain-containing protein
MNKKGFTLIELLIVIALLGTLAVALLAAIDPFEQFKKGTDTGVRNTTQEFYNAAIRYYANRSGWPTDWEITPADLYGPESLDTAGFTTALISAGELKANFNEIAQDQLDDIYVSIQGSTLLACFTPTSKSLQSADKNTKYLNAALTNGVPYTDVSTTDGVCKVSGGETDCMWCIY